MKYHISTAKDWLINSAYLAAFVGVLIGIVWLLNEYGPRTNARRTYADDYRDICVSKGGKAVWNGRHWDCIK